MKKFLYGMVSRTCGRGTTGESKDGGHTYLIKDDTDAEHTYTVLSGDIATIVYGEAANDARYKDERRAA